MKNIWLLIGLLSFASVSGQYNKAEVFMEGTQINFYKNQCGNPPAEAAGKISFCDSQNNLGVVMRSYGLPYYRIKKMAQNYANQDEIFITDYGIGIHKTNGTWENIPSLAIHNGSPYTTATTNAMMLPDGNLIFTANNTGNVFFHFNVINKQITQVSLGNLFLTSMTYDTDHQVAWFLLSGSSNTQLVKYDGTQTSVVYTWNANISFSQSEKKLTYKNNKIIFGGNSGLHIVDVSDMNNPVYTHFDTTTSPAMLYDKILDWEIDTSGNIWMVQSDNISHFILTKFDASFTTLNSYPYTTTSGDTYNAKRFAINPDADEIWLTSNYGSFALVQLQFNAGNPVWQEMTTADFTPMNIDMPTYMDNVFYRNNKFYFTSQATNSDYDEIIIYDGTNWTSINDTDNNNLSNRLTDTSYMGSALADDNGGTWWFNNTRDYILHIDANNDIEYMFTQNNFVDNNAVLDTDGLPIVKRSNPTTLAKVNIPNFTTFSTTPNVVSDMQRVGNQIWIFDKTVPKIDVYENGSLLQTYTINDNLNDYQQFVVLENRDVWFGRGYGNDIQLKKYDINTGTITDYTHSATVGYFKNILPAPNNTFWIIGSYSTLVYFENNQFYNISTDYQNAYIQDGVVDENGKLYVSKISSGLGMLITVENPTQATPDIIYHYYDGYNPIEIPEIEILPTKIGIDNSGRVYFSGSRHYIFLTDTDTSTAYQIPIPASVYKLDEITYKLYPNPAISMTHIISEENIDIASIYTLSGQLLQQIKPHKKVFDIDMQKLDRGIYLLKLQSNSKISIKRLLKK